LTGIKKCVSYSLIVLIGYPKGHIPFNSIRSIVTREKLFMAKGKPQQTGMTAKINSIPTCAI
jgi:hypothetical protein